LNEGIDDTFVSVRCVCVGVTLSQRPRRQAQSRSNEPGGSGDQKAGYLLGSGISVGGAMEFGETNYQSLMDG